MTATNDIALLPEKYFFISQADGQKWFHLKRKSSSTIASKAKAIGVYYAPHDHDPLIIPHLANFFAIEPAIHPP